MNNKMDIYHGLMQTQMSAIWVAMHYRKFINRAISRLIFKKESKFEIWLDELECISCGHPYDIYSD